MAKRPVGRPSKYTDKIADSICQRIAEGESLRKICDSTPSLPSWRTVIRWQRDEIKYNDFVSKITRAREVQAETMVDSLADIAGSATPKDAHVARLRCDVGKWMAEKLKPKKYGRQFLELDLPEAGLTVQLSKADRELIKGAAQALAQQVLVEGEESGERLAIEHHSDTEGVTP